jgi:hypothetical protein
MLVDAPADVRVVLDRQHQRQRSARRRIHVARQRDHRRDRVQIVVERLDLALAERPEAAGSGE